MTPQDVADQLVARLQVKRESLERLPKIPTLALQRANLEGQIEAFTQALAMVRRLT